MSLFIIATPIGNLQDLTERARETLASSDMILCEDTRVTQKLLRHLHIEKPLLSYHQHSRSYRIEDIFRLLEDGKQLALVTDAGTPGINDPGGKLVESIVQRFPNAISIVPIPGPNACVAALSVSGFPADVFLFLGFPPHKKGRSAFFDRVAVTPSTVVFYESTHRILKTLVELQKKIGTRKIVVCRELTKLHETMYRGSVKDVIEQLESTSLKGEFVVVVRAL